MKMSMEHRWNDTDGGNQSTGRRTYLSATLPTTNLACTDVGSNPSLHGDGPATNHVTASAQISRDSCSTLDRDKTNASLMSCVASVSTLLGTRGGNGNSNNVSSAQ